MTGFCKRSTTSQLSTLRNQQSLVNLLLECGADPNPEGERTHTPLMRAADSGQLEVAKILLEDGADANFIAFEGFPSLSAPRHSALSLARK